MSRIKSAVVRHKWFAAVGLIVVGLGVFAGVRFAGDELVAITMPAEEGGALPTATALTADGGGTVFRIDPTASEVRYEVNEVLAGNDNKVTGSTRYLAGDVLIDRAEPAGSRLGEIVIDVSRLRSDNRLRDHRLRSAYLESEHFPLAKLTEAKVSGLPDSLDEGREYPITIDATLTTKDQPHPTSWTGTATVDGDTLTATASADLRLSELGMGPINLGGLVRTDDEVRLTIDLTARAGGFTPPERLAADGTAERADTAEADAENTPSFRNDIAPLLSQNCASCHQPGEAGADVWKLANAGDAAMVSDGLGPVVSTGYMPPWPASELGIPLQHSRRLDDRAKQLIADWSAAGGPLDVAPDFKIEPPAEPEVQEPRADVVLRSEEPYFGKGERLDDYRCFVVDPGFTKESWVRGIGFEPDQKPVVHHALIFKVPAAAKQKALEMSGKDGRPGYTCFGGPGMGSINGEGLVGGWAPGQRQTRMEGVDALKFAAGDFLVMQVHYHFAHADPGDRSTVNLEVDDDGKADDGRPLVDLHVRQLVAPVEIPCRSDEQGPLCDRQAAIDRAAKEYGPAGPMIANGIHLLCRTKPSDFNTVTDGLGRSKCDHSVRQEGEIIDVLGHMHELGTTFRMTLNPDTPDAKVLLDIPTWDFNWQLNYQPVEPVKVRAGDRIRIECTWDTALRKDPEPRYYVFSEGTNDEMCFSTITTRPATAEAAQPPVSIGG